MRKITAKCQNTISPLDKKLTPDQKQKTDVSQLLTEIKKIDNSFFIFRTLTRMEHVLRQEAEDHLCSKIKKIKILIESYNTGSEGDTNRSDEKLKNKIFGYFAQFFKEIAE